MIDNTFDVIFTEIEEDIQPTIGKGLRYKLYLLNDNYNYFDYVIQCIVKVLGYTWEQAEQLALNAHIKGKALMKESNDKFELIIIKEAFKSLNINTEIK
jgi:ATP-dependent Clp protease adaptor protein ClpS